MEIRSVIRCIWPLVFGVACATEDVQPEQDLGDVEGIEEVEEGLTDLSAQCSFTAGSGLMTLGLLADDIAMISKSSSGLVVINGFACASGATSTAVKRIEVTATTGAQTVILDYMGGTFALGGSPAGSTGILVSLGAGTDALKIRGSKLADSYVFGSTGAAINGDTVKDITPTDVETFVVTLSDGADVFSAAGNTTTGGAAFASNMTIYGGAGNDTLRGGDGDDTYNGGDGDDTFQTGTADDGSDTMNGGAGTDIADYSTRTTAVTVTIDGTANDGATAGAEADDVEIDVETLKGGTAGDSLTGSTTANTISGGGGNDTITGGDGIDILNGDADDDTFAEGAAANGGDTMNGGAGTDTVSYASRTGDVVVNLNATADDGETGEADKVATDVENVTTGAGADDLTGSTSANVLTGGAGTDDLIGGDGNDTLIGGADADTMDGGNGDDTFDEGAATSGADEMTGGAGVDLVNYGARTGDITIVMDGTTPGGDGAEGDTVGTDVENLRTGDGEDDITGNALDNTLEGGDDVDTIDSGAGDDTVDGDAGDDIIDCGLGDADILLDATVDTTDPHNCEL